MRQWLGPHVRIANECEWASSMGSKLHSLVLTANRTISHASAFEAGASLRVKGMLASHLHCADAVILAA
eukprot:scaffold5640_cov30-Tisochrysis_lutea.AAC.5